MTASPAPQKSERMTDESSKPDWYGKQPTKARKADERRGPMTFKEDRIFRRLWFALDVIAAAGLVACAAALFWFLK